MMYTTTVLAAILGLASVSSAHMIMATPVPFGKSTLNNSPLLADGSDFPCKQRSGVYAAEGASNTMAIGASVPLSFIGSATHGGGSCQISATYDETPTKSSTFKVIHSIEGGCPIKGVAGNNGDSASAVDPDTYSFTIPSSLPTGTAVLAWTWFNKVGNREMYMNCAPITITGASSKRSQEAYDDLLTLNTTQFMERDTAAFDALPDMFTANIGPGCGTQDTTDLAFPNPGDSVERDGTATATPSPPTGSACGSTVAGAPATVGPIAATSAASVATSAAVVASSAPALSGGVFATVASSAGTQASATVAPAASSVAASPVVASSPVASAAASPAAPAPVGTGSAIAAGTACTTEGMWNCIGGTSFQQCASGTWSVVQQMAAGTVCTAGQTMNIDIVAGKPKRAVRFSTEHVRRHVHRSS